MKEKILTKLQELRKDEMDDLAAMEFAAGRSVEMIQAYCNIRIMPEELLGVGVALAKMLLDGEGAIVKGIKEGDVSVTFAEGVSKEDERALLHCFHTELDRYRRMDW